MRLDLDTYKEILDTITRNKSRSLLTGFGVFWGVFMLIALMGGGQGLKEMLQNNFTGFATNTAIIWAQNTTKPYKGFNKGRSWQMEEKDLDRLRHQVPELDVITPLLFGGNKSVVFGDKKFSGSAATSRGIEILPDASFTSSSTARTFLPKASATSSPIFTATFSILDLILSSTRTVLASFNIGRSLPTLAVEASTCSEIIL